jgi:putative endonuclease
MHFVYVLKSSSFAKSYVGMTDSPERRLREHNEGRHAYTKRYMPWELVWKEECDTLKNAHSREKYLKSAAGRKFLKEFVFKN